MVDVCQEVCGARPQFLPENKFTEELAGSVAAFKAARLFLPQKVDEMRPDISAVDAFPFLDDTAVLHDLKQELPTYLAKADDVSMNTEPLPWWKKHAYDLPCRSSAAYKVAFVQPSAASERVFPSEVLFRATAGLDAARLYRMFSYATIHNN